MSKKKTFQAASEPSTTKQPSVEELARFWRDTCVSVLEPILSAGNGGHPFDFMGQRLTSSCLEKFSDAHALNDVTVRLSELLTENHLDPEPLLRLNQVVQGYVAFLRSSPHVTDKPDGIWRLKPSGYGLAWDRWEKSPPPLELGLTLSRAELLLGQLTPVSIAAQSEWLTYPEAVNLVCSMRGSQQTEVYPRANARPYINKLCHHKSNATRHRLGADGKISLVHREDLVERVTATTKRIADKSDRDKLGEKYIKAAEDKRPPYKF